MKNLTKEQVYVLIDNQPDCDRAIEILTKAGEKMWEDESAFIFNEETKHLLLNSFDKDWLISVDTNSELTRVTLDELERILMPKIKKSELLDRIEDLEENVINLGNKLQYLIDNQSQFDAINAVIGKDTSIVKHELIAEKPAFEVGKVYKDGHIMFYCTRIENEKLYGFGFDLIGQWWEDDGDFWAGDFTEATPEEWFKRLDEEAKKRYPKDCNVKCLHNTIYNKIDTLNFTGSHSNMSCLRHKDSNNYVCCIMDNGKWAEIIEEPQYVPGTLGAFWDGEWDESCLDGSVYVGYFEIFKDGYYIAKNNEFEYDNFKPLKFD